MRKFKKIINMLLMCSMILSYPVYAAENVSENQSTTKDNINNRGYFAEKNHIFYYLKCVEIEENHDVLQLYQYDLQTQKESPLSEDYFHYDNIAPVYNMRACNDGYIYFEAEKEQNKMEEYQSGYYRVSINGGKSEYVCKYKEIAFLSDNWIYWAEKNIFYNLATKEIVENTVTNSLNSILLKEPANSSCEHHDVIYLDAYHIDLNAVQTVYKNGQPLEAGIYALPLHEQDAFHKIELEEKIGGFQLYDNYLYYHIGSVTEQYSAIKQYSLQNHTIKTLVESKDDMEGTIYDFAVYNNMLYYRYFIQKNGKTYINLYCISLKEEQSSPVIAVPYCIGGQIHIFEDIVCSAYVDRWITGNWRIFDIHTGKRYFINLYE